MSDWKTQMCKQLIDYIDQDIAFYIRQGHDLEAAKRLAKDTVKPRSEGNQAMSTEPTPKAPPGRTIIQGFTDNADHVYCVCSDGTLWRLTRLSANETNWDQMPIIPTDPTIP